MSDVAKIFWSGRSQAVRLPKEFRFEGSEVRIRREGSRVILTPADVDYTAEDIALDVTRGIEELRALIAEGEDESGDAELDMQAIIRECRARYDARKKD
jgi:virulence-associated protein VagC